MLSTLHWFRDEYETHVFDRRCPAGTCTELARFRIDAAKCVGCTVCARHCPTGAIVGQPKQLHTVVEDKCVACGSCVTVCKFAAVTKEF